MNKHLLLFANINSILYKTFKNIVKATLSIFILLFSINVSAQTATPKCFIGGVDFGRLFNYHMVFTKGNEDANWQSASKGFAGNVAVNGVLASERTSGTVPFAGIISTNASTIGVWQGILDDNIGQSSGSANQTNLITELDNSLESAFNQINALTVTPGYSSIASTSLNGLNTQNGVAQTFVINVTSGFGISSQINITGDANDVFILRWDNDAIFSNGYNGEVKFQSGGAIVPLGNLKASNFIHVAGDISSSGGGSNPAAPYPQGPRSNNGTGSLITGGSDFDGGGFFTGYWLTTGVPTLSSAGEQPYGVTGSFSNAIFVGGFYTKTTKFSLTSGSSGVYVSPSLCSTIANPSTNPDFNSSFVNVAVSGNVNTNDNVSAGTTYGTSPILLSSPAGSAATLTIKSNGTYSFTANTPSVYTYDVQVCVPGQSAPCPSTKLVITVLNANSNTNAPVANVDIATTNLNTAVTLRTLANDAAGNANNVLVPSSVTITSAPTRGTATVNAATGDITYIPNAGFSGRDTLTYQVCDNQTPAKCATAIQIITVNATGTRNSTTAADDYRITSINTTLTGNVKANDSDAEGNIQTVTAQTTTVSGKGTLVLNTDGSYTFTPATGFTGPVDFAYTTCDNGTPAACASATLHVLVFPAAAGGALLPISLIDFTATKQLKVVDLNWQTSNEQNSSHFDVEFSKDGSKFESIGRVSAAGNSSTTKNYASVHLSPANGINYYRLKLVDVDGTFKYSKVLTVKFSDTKSFKIMPNPSADRVYITSNGGGVLQSVGVYSMTGKLLQQVTNFTLGKSIDLSTYAPSVYILKLTEKDGTTDIIKVVRK